MLGLIVSRESARDCCFQQLVDLTGIGGYPTVQIHEQVVVADGLPFQATSLLLVETLACLPQALF
jgi:hypothetical protein